MPESIQPNDVEKNPANFATLDSSSNHPPKSDDSTTLKWSGGNYSGKAFRTHFAILLLLTIFFVFGGFYWGGSLAGKIGTLWMWLIVLAIPIVLWIRYTIRYLYNTMTISYELSRDRLITKKGFFHRTTDATLILRINDVKLEQNLWDRFVNGGIGTVVVYSSDPTDPELRLTCLDKPQEAFDTIDALVAEYTKKRGVKTLGGGFMDSSDGSVM